MPEVVFIPPEEKPKVDQQVTVTIEQFKELIRELRKPSDEEQAKIDKEKAILARRREEMVELGRIEQEQRELNQSRCGHTKPDGKPSTGGQVHSDGLYHEFCLRCQKEIRVMKPSQDMMQMGTS